MCGSPPYGGTDQCKVNVTNATWIDCNGCCCWLPAGSTTTHGTQICGADAANPCCAGRGRTATATYPKQP
jgi:hypothetical protein